MKKVFDKILNCNDVDVLKNCITIMAENEEIGMNDRVMLDNLLQLRGEVDSCNFDEETAKLHLCIIGEIGCIESARVNFHKVQYARVNEWDFCVLWGEMIRFHGDKIKKWFPGIGEIDFEDKILEECKVFLNSGKLPYYDLNL